MLAPAKVFEVRTASYKLLHYVRLRMHEARQAQTYSAGLFVPSSRLNAAILDLALVHDALLFSSAAVEEVEALLMAACRVAERALADLRQNLSAAELAERAKATHRRLLPQAAHLPCLTQAVEDLILRPTIHADRLSAEQRRLRHDLALVLALEAQVVRSSVLVALGQPLNLASLVDDRDQHLYLFCDRYGCFNSAEIGELPTQDQGQPALELPNDWLKRSFDFTGSLLIILIAAPLLLALYLAARQGSGPALYSQKRVGRNGRVFRCWKFRSMVPNAEELLEKILREDPKAREEYALYSKLRNDPRITPVGRFLRKTSLDELPQLFNVLFGNMSLVGPRPIAVEERDRWGIHFRTYKQLRPGLTGPWQLYFRSDCPYADQFEHVARYAQQWSFWKDLRYVIETLAVPFRQRGAY